MNMKFAPFLVIGEHYSFKGYGFLDVIGELLVRLTGVGAVSHPKYRTKGCAGGRNHLGKIRHGLESSYSFLCRSFKKPGLCFYGCFNRTRLRINSNVFNSGPFLNIIFQTNDCL